MSDVFPYAGRLALTPDGGAVVTGQSLNGADYDYATIRYSPPPDADGDGIDSADEDVNANGNLLDDDTDGDGIANYLDDDDDGDDVLTAAELPVSTNTDGDGIPDYLDQDDDNDGVLTKDEDTNGNGNFLDDDTDGDSIPDYLDADAMVIDPAHTARFRKGAAVPGAGVDAYIPAGATWASFGVPAINNQGKLAYVGKWKNVAGSPIGYGSGAFVDGVLKVALGQGAPTLPGADGDGGAIGPQECALHRSFVSGLPPHICLPIPSASCSPASPSSSSFSPPCRFSAGTGLRCNRSPGSGCWRAIRAGKRWSWRLRRRSTVRTRAGCAKW